MSALLHQMRQDSPLGLWPLETNANDVSGNARHGTAQAGVTFGQTMGHMQGALFNRTSTGYIDLGTVTAWQTLTAWSIEAWVRTNIAPHTSTAGWCGIFSESYNWQGAGSTNVQMEIGMGFNVANATDFRTGRYASSPAWVSADSGVTPISGVLYHVLGSWDGSYLRIYVDGALRGSIASSGAINGDQQYRIGHRHDNAIGETTYAFPGYLSHVALYSSALSLERVKAHREAGLRSGVSY